MTNPPRPSSQESAPKALPHSCQSEYIEKGVGYHRCKRAPGHPGKHLCGYGQCARAWTDYEAKIPATELALGQSILAELRAAASPPTPDSAPPHRLVPGSAPTHRWQTRYGDWLVPCAGGCGDVVMRFNKPETWICERCHEEASND